VEDNLDTLTKLVSYFEEYEDNTKDSRDASEKNRDYYDGKQWTSEEIALLKERKQPIVTFNLVKRTVDALLGVEKQNRTDPKALPRTPQHEKDADSCTDALRYVLDNNDFDQIASDCFEQLLIEGVEAVDVQVIPKGKQYEVQIHGVSWDRIFWDVHSRKRDFSDAKYLGVVIWMDYDDARARAEAEGWDADVLEQCISTANEEVNTFEDKPSHKWNDSNRKRIKVCYIQYKETKWNYAYFTQGGILKSAEMPFLDEDDLPESSFVFQSAFVDRDGHRYGYAQTLISPQDEVNKRRSKALHLISQRQTFGNKTSGIEAAQVKRELAKPDGHVELEHGEFGRDFGVIPTSDMTNGNFQLLQEAKEVFNVVGANTSVTGKEDRVMSGRAEIVRQQAGLRELAPVMDAHSHWKKRIYRKVWNRIRQYWDQERWIRVTDDESNMRWVPLNQKVTLGQQLMQQYKDDPQTMQMIQQRFGNDPRLQQVVGVNNQLAEIDVDILIEESPDVATIQEEQFELMAKMYQANPNAIPFDSVIELSSIRNKDQILERIRGTDEQRQQQQQAQEQERQMAMQERQMMMKARAIELENKQADTQGKKAKAMKDMMDAQSQQIENQTVARMING